MRLARKLAFSLVIGILVVMLGYAYFQFRQEVALSQSDLHRARYIGLAWLGTIEAVWDREGPRRVQELVQQANQRAQQIALRVMPLDDSVGGRSHLPLSPEQWDALQAGEPVRTVQRDETGQEWGHVFVLLSVDNRHPAVVEYVEPLSEEQTFIRMSHRGIAGATLAVVLVCGLIAIGLQYKLVGQPIQRLRDKARRAGEGDFSGALLIPQKDEIGDLACDINAMCARIAEANRQLTAETEARVAALEQLRHTDRLATVGQLAAGVAHELGTPLSVVSARAQVIASPDVPHADAVGSAQIIVQQCDRMTAIIHQLLDFSRRRAATFDLTDLRDVVTRTLEMLSTEARKAGVELRCEGLDRPVLVRIDENQIQQALTNVVLNGIQAMPDGGCLRLRITQDRPESAANRPGPSAPYTCVSVTDEGTGIPPDQIDRVFEPFFTTKEVGEGTGLGLAVAHGIVAEHAGSITVESRLGGGSCFTIVLPSADDRAGAGAGAV